MSPLQSILGIGSLLGSAQQGSLLGQLGSTIGGKLFGPGTTGSAGTIGEALNTADQVGQSGFDNIGNFGFGGYSTNPDDYAWEF